MAEYILSKKSLDDLRDIWNYTEKTWSETQADKYYESLVLSFEYIANHPDSVGRSYSEIKPDYRGFHCGRHIIFYRILQNGKVRIIRILHEKMDYPRHLI
ncbi:MAG: type II toxin-antitoxin system RelE/ParE family toxin [Bacteroidales bacterium]|nr:type II toxin-antitoxin system RelE/ParE family toxin [Bacteroidales bacterium]